MAPSATTDTTNASNISSGTLAAARLPATVVSTTNATGAGAKFASATGAGVANNCTKWDANGNVVDAGLPCFSGNFPSLGGGTNSGGTFVIGTGASLSASGTGSIVATSVPASGVSGLAPSATTDTTNASNIASGTLAAARLPATVVSTTNATGAGAKFASATQAGTSNNCAKWDANGNVVDAGSPCNSPSVLQAASQVSEGDSITYGYETTGTCNGGSCNYPSLLAFDERSTLTNRGTSGYQACDVAARETMNNDLNSLDNNSIYTLMIGTNDANVKGVGAYESVFKQCHQAVIAWNAVANKYAANSVNCTNTGTWTTTAGWALNGDYSFTNGSTKTCPITTYGGPIYAWYYIGDNNTGAFTYSVDGGTPVALTTATTPTISTQNFPTTSYGWSLIRVPVAAGAHSIKFAVTSATGTGTGQAVDIGAIGTPPAQSTYSGPRVYVGGIPRQEGDANSATTAEYDSDVKADVSLLAGDGLSVYYVNVRNYLCTNVIGGLCYNPLGTAQDMVGNNSSNPVESGEDMLHPNDLGHNELKEAFEAVMQFTPYVAPYTGTGGKAVTSTGAGVSGDCAKWDANGNIVDAGAACGAGSGGSGSSAWSSLTPGTNTAGAFVLGTGASLAASGSGTIAATSVPASGVSGTLAASNLPAPAASALGGVEALAQTPHQWINSIATSGAPSASQPAFTDISGTATDSQLPSDQCVLTGYTVTAANIGALTPITAPVYTIPGLSVAANQRICFIDIRATTGFAAASSTVSQVRIQSSGGVVFSPNQDVSTVAANNFWSDAGSFSDRANTGIQAAFTFTGATAAASAGSVNIVIGVRTMPTGF